VIVSQAMLAQLKPAVMACLVMLVTAGCSSANLGQIDESESDRESMPGPGIFDGEDGETTLKWTNESQPAAAQSEVAQSEAAQSEVVAAQPAENTIPAMDEKAEFEQFKQWNELRTNAPQSPEYQEFLQWLEYRKFKAGTN